MGDRLRDLFQATGPMTTSAFTHHAHDSGIWSEEEWNAMAFREAQSQVRAALKQRDPYGLPFAGQTTDEDEEDGGRIWAIRQTWLFPDYEVNIDELVRQRDERHDAAVLLADECRRRFGKAPSLARRDIVEAA